MRPRRDKSTSFSIQISSNHASLLDHFPGNPIVPGSVILDAIISQLKTFKEVEPHLPVLEFVKFLRPLRPEDTLDLRISQLKDSSVRFEGFVKDMPFIAGKIRFIDFQDLDSETDE